MDEHKKFLADRLLSDERPVTYRLLSRAFDVHVNTAKEILYDFYKTQNREKPNSIHATYLLLGKKSTSALKIPTGNPDLPSSMPETEARSDFTPPVVMTLVPEEKLEGHLLEYDEVKSAHIHSLAPHPLKDLTSLSDVTQSLSEYRMKEDPLMTGEKYGTIVNSRVKRRVRAGGALQAAPKAMAVRLETTSEKESQESSKASSIKGDKPMPKLVSLSSSVSKAPPTLKKTSSGGIMQSFAKAATKPLQNKLSSKKEREDTSTPLSDDGEADDADLPYQSNKLPDDGVSGQSRKQRHDELRRMMEESEEEDMGAEKEGDADEEMEEAPEQAPEIVPVPSGEANEQPEEVVSNAKDGRRRGRRRVTKKRRYLDAEGFMVTTEEQAWESFSDGEVSHLPRVSQGTPATSQESITSKRGSGKIGQGSIKSFFQRQS